MGICGGMDRKKWGVPQNLKEDNMDTLQKNAANLLKLKSLVTLMLTVTFCLMVAWGGISDENFMTIFSMVITFYFVTQAEKKPAESAGGQT